MKIRSLLLGSAAIAGLSTAGYAADLGVVTSLDVCDSLGLSGLTISSDDNCLVITGGVNYEYDFGTINNGFVVQSFVYNTARNTYTIMNPNFLDQKSDTDLWLQFVATADSDFGQAKATIKLISNDAFSSGGSVQVKEAWVSVGDTTMLMAGIKGSIFNNGDDAPLNYLGLFNSSSVNTGVRAYDNASPTTGGAVIQVVSNLGNGVSVSGGLENLFNSNNIGGTPPDPTAVGVIAYAGDGITAHASGAIDLNGNWMTHAGFTGTWDNFKVVGAVASSFGPPGGIWWNALGSASATFDMFTLAASVEATSVGEFGVGGSVVAKVTDGVTVNLGSRFFNGIMGPTAQAEAGVSAAVTEGITINGAIGAVSGFFGTVGYGTIGASWDPKGGFTASSALTANTIGAWKWVFKASKSIK